MNSDLFGEVAALAVEAYHDELYDRWCREDERLADRAAQIDANEEAEALAGGWGWYADEPVVLKTIVPLHILFPAENYARWFVETDEYGVSIYRRYPLRPEHAR